MTGAYDLRLVAVSVVVAAIASYAALGLAGRVSTSGGKASAAWLPWRGRSPWAPASGRCTSSACWHSACRYRSP